MLPNVDAFDEEWCQSFLRELKWNTLSTNMPLENLLATVKASVPHKKTAAEEAHVLQRVRSANLVEVASRLGESWSSSARTSPSLRRPERQT